ncbi:tripartite motif-containing protein 2-like protein [Leptotrombidium deliense]|uniref:Tripartite motif-containing protein 2-like protein n=1 Tax=Leptotrombidium deliense TaxID=299467 RepID=A0A443SFS3_9ACAR|nr:tripartite motif-containing protein 2-like protein [Leptotrombidium deliense]
MSFSRQVNTPRGLDEFRSQLGRKMTTMSTLVETVSINYEDFTEGFLTCGTCLCTYDGGERCPKLLPCSHTICRSCLESMASQSGVRETGTFRCPICRETIGLPRGGVVAFPPSFLVNQLLDLISRQRREVVPKCSQHVSQELLFCETCDCVFCNVCTNGSHSNIVRDVDTKCEHTVIPFSIAIKRMSEILLYKAHQCIGKLNEAYENVLTEMRKLDQNSDHAFEDINRTFQEMINVVDRRRQELLSLAKKMREDKRRVLQEQLDIIETEKAKVEMDCSGLQYQVEVRNITKKISDLSEKIDSVVSLQEPRENCFIRYEHLHNSAVEDIQNAVNEFGSIRTSKTFPSLCTATVGKCSANLKTVAHVTTYDYNGHLQKSGGDLVSAEVVRCEDGTNVPTRIVDNRDGTYDALFVPPKGGSYLLRVNIFGRPIKSTPLEFEASSHINPLCIYGCRGVDTHQFTQPVGVALNVADNKVFVLDTGNGRIKVLSQNACTNSPFTFNAHLTDKSLDNKACTGIALNQTSHSLLVSNWRNRNVTELSINGEFVRYFSHRDLLEPTYLSVNSKGEIIVADNTAKAVFVFHPSGKLRSKIESVCGGGVPRFGVVGAIGIGPNDDIIVADSRIQIFSSDGNFVREIFSEGKLRGAYGGVTYDQSGNLLATRVEKNRSFIQVFDYASGTFKFAIDSNDAKLKRPSALVTTNDFHVIVVDLGNDCIKKYRYV